MVPGGPRMLPADPGMAQSGGMMPKPMMPPQKMDPFGSDVAAQNAWSAQQRMARGQVGMGDDMPSMNPAMGPRQNPQLMQAMMQARMLRRPQGPQY